MTNTALLVIVIVVVAVLALGAWLYTSRRRSRVLRTSFGPEYDRAVSTHGNKARAEAELLKRKERVKKLAIVPLSPVDADRFLEEWRRIQARFVDDPRSAVADADRVVGELMQKRGYPMSDFEQAAADISVDHPAVVSNYREAHDIALRDRSGEADTEDLRKAIVHFRALFDELIQVGEPEPAQVRH